MGVIGSWSGQLASAATLTIMLALVTLPFGLGLGLAVALARNATVSWLRIMGEAFTTIFRGLPELLTLLLIYYGAQILSEGAATRLGLSVGLSLPPFAAGVIALSLVFAAYSSEAFLAAIRALDRGQSGAAKSLGMTKPQMFRFVMLPQMMRLALPALANNWLTLLKDTSLVSVISLNELLRTTSVAADSTRQPFVFYAVACALYLVMTAASGIVLRRVQKAVNSGWERLP